MIVAETVVEQRAESVAVETPSAPAHADSDSVAVAEPVVAPAADVEAGPVALAVSPTDAFEVPADVEAPVAVDAQPADTAVVAEAAPAVAAPAAPAAPAVAPAPVEAAPVEPVAAPAPAPAAAPAPAVAQPSAAPASASLEAVLQQAGLVWVNTDAEKLRAAQEAASRLPRPVRTPRERKPLPPVDTTPMQQVETTHR
ncbi:hypothetical protein FEP67_02414 [Burkholderia multivorans]|nr:hypothetical protein [Burkholderia multivorans]